MRDLDLKIADRGGVYVVKARGRANFEYAVPLRELVKNLAGFERFCIDLSECTAMDSTFMGVLTMTALKGAKSGKKVEILGASEVLQKLLRDPKKTELNIKKSSDSTLRILWRALRDSNPRPTA